jgi:hypothetical protein
MYTPTYIATAQTKVVRSAAGKLGNIVFQGGVAGSVIGYDNASAASGDIIFSFDSTNARGTEKFGGATLKNGLTIITSADTKLTVMTAPQSN